MTLYNWEGDEIINEKELPIVVHIRHNPTGEVRIAKDHTGWYRNDEFSEFIWSEGNYSCDCNRCLFFKRVKDEDESDCECGDNEYSVRIYDEKGKLIYTDFGEDGYKNGQYWEKK